MDWQISPPQVPTMTEAATHALQLRHLGMQNQMQDLQLQQERQTLQANQMWQTSMQRNGGNAEAALVDVAGKIPPQHYFQIQSAITKQQQERASMAKTQGEAADAENDYFGRLAYGVSKAGYTPEALHAALDTVVKTYPHYAAHASQIWQASQDPAMLKQTIDQAISQSKTGNTDRQKDITEAREQQTANSLNAERAVTTENARTEGMQKRITLGQYADLGMTQQQREQLDQEAANLQQTTLRDVNTDENAKANTKIRRDALNQRISEDAKGSGDPEDVNSYSKGQANNAITRLETRENILNAQRRALGNALAGGKTYIDRLGNVVNLDKASNYDADTAAELRQSMKSRFEEASDELKKIYPTKNSLLSHVGRPPAVSTETAIRAIDAGSSSAPAPAAGGQAAPAAKTVIPPFPTSLSSSDLGKVYQSKTGQKLRITAINPQNPKQFKSVVVP